MGSRGEKKKGKKKKNENDKKGKGKRILSKEENEVLEILANFEINQKEENEKKGNQIPTEEEMKEVLEIVEIVDKLQKIMGYFAITQESGSEKKKEINEETRKRVRKSAHKLSNNNKNKNKGHGPTFILEEMQQDGAINALMIKKI